MRGVAAEVIEDAAALEALQPEWRDLWRRRPAALPFQAPEWLIPWWRHFSPGSLFVLCARRDGRLVGIAPGYIEHGPLGRRILPLGISLSDHLDVLVDPDCADAALAALAAAAQSRSDAWDVWELEELLPDAMALRLPLPAGWSEAVHPQSACPVLTVHQAVELRFLAPKAKRQNLNTARNRAARRGTVRIARAEGDMVPAAFEDMVRLHGARWTSRGAPGLLRSEAVLGFHREVLPLLDRAGLLRFYTLAIDKRVVATHYGLMAGGSAHVYMTGFDPDYAFASPGAILAAHAIEDAMREGCREIDFLRGREPYKYEWGAEDRWNLKRSIRHG